MEVNLTLLLVVALIIFFVYSTWEEARSWESVAEASGLHMGEVQSKYAYLKGQGIKCKLKTVTSLANRGGGSGTVTTLKLEVHRQDIQRARQLLNEYRQA